MTEKGARTRWGRWLLIGTFLLALGLPVFLRVIGQPYNRIPSEDDENKGVAQRPHSLDAQFPQRFETWYNATFGLRGLFLHIRNTLSFFVFNTSATPSVLVGRDGWLFLDQGTIRTTLFSQNELDERITVLSENKRRLEALGIVYLFVVAPDKHTIYPEFLPESYDTEKPQSRGRQLISALRRQGELIVPDLFSVLLAAKPHLRTYHLLDTHWNADGAFIAYTELSRELRERSGLAVGTVTMREDLRMTEETGGDSLRMLGLGFDLDMTIRSQEPKLFPTKPPRAELLSKQRHATNRGVLVYRNAQAQAGALLSFRDSFFTQPIPYLAEDYRRSTYVWTRCLDYERILREKPALVIHETVERGLNGNATALGFCPPATPPKAPAPP